MIIDPFDDGDEEQFLRLRNEIFDAADDFLAWFTVPLVNLNREGKVIEVRSGVLFRVGDSHFVVTAGHGLPEYYDKGYYLAIAMPKKGELPIVLLETAQVTKSRDEDLAVLKLSATTLSRMKGHFRFLRLSDFWRGHTYAAERAFYLLLGTPRDMLVVESDQTKCFLGWKYLTVPFRGNLEDVENYDASLHFILGYDRSTVNGQGKSVLPHGMSGCGIWYVSDCLNPNNFDKSQFRLVGIQTSWHKRFEYVKGTFIYVVEAILWKHFPETRQLLQFHR